MVEMPSSLDNKARGDLLRRLRRLRAVAGSREPQTHLRPAGREETEIREETVEGGFRPQFGAHFGSSARSILNSYSLL